MSRKQEHSGGVNLALIVTPMLDMAFQILSFFIMTYHPSALEGHIPGNLAPPANPAIRGPHTRLDAEPPVPVHETDLDPTEAVQVKVKSVPRGQVERNRREGQLTQILVKQPTDVNFQLVADVDSDISQALALLEKHLKQLGAERGAVKIEGDGELRQMYVMMVYDACKRAGVAKVHFVPPSRVRADLK